MYFTAEKQEAICEYMIELGVNRCTGPYAGWDNMGHNGELAC